MNSKIILAFLTGAALASALVYVAVREPASPVRPVKHVAAATKPIYANPEPEPLPPLRSPVVSAEVPNDYELPGEPAPAPAARNRRFEKPSPLSRARNVEVAQVSKPPISAPATPTVHQDHP